MEGEQPLSQILKVLEALKQASHELQAHPPDPDSTGSNPSPAIKALLELETESDTILSKDPNLSTLSQHLTDLKSLLEERTKHGGLIRNFLTRRVSTHSISRVAGSIESEIQAWIDRESIENLTTTLKAETLNEEELLTLLTRFETRVSQGFDRELQDLALKSRIFNTLERVLCDPRNGYSVRVREGCASVISALISFNKDVFVGEVVVMGPLIHSLVSMSTFKSIKVLTSLIRCIKSPFVDEIESNGEIAKIICYLGSKDLQIKVAAFDCVLEIGYFGRKEAIEAMLREGLVGKLVELQRSELGGDLIELGRLSGKEEGGRRESREKGERRFLEGHPFASCVARFWVQLEVGEGLRQREKRAFKVEILDRVRESCVSDAEAATIVAEVLWGSSP